MGWVVGGGAQVVIGVRKIVKNGCLSRTMFESGRKNKSLNFQSLLHPPTHPACPPPCVGLPLASPSLSLGRQPKTGLLSQAQAVLTPPRQSQSVGFSQTNVCLPQRPLPAPLESLLFYGVCLLFLKEMLFYFPKKYLKKKKK
jgi:hypothetical protein